METYFKFKLWCEYYIPLGLMAICILFIGFILLLGFIADKWEKRFTKEDEDEHSDN